MTRLLRITKKQYYVTLLAKNKSDFKATRKILNCATKRSKCKPIKVSLIQEQGVTITNSEDIANRFCQHFANVGPNLASKIIPLSFNVYLTLVSSSSLQNFDSVKIN